MTTQELTLVPPGRFAALLSNARRANGLDVAELVARSGGRFDAQFLSEVERGRIVLSDPEVEELARLYGVHSEEPIVPERSQLVVDLGGGKMTIGDTGVSVGTGNGEVDQILERYLSLLYIMRGLKPGSDLTLRDRDLAVLAESLEQEIRTLESKLGQLMGSQQTKERTGLLGGRFALPAAGLLVALTAIGSLVIVGGGAADVDSTPVNDGVGTAQIDSAATAPATGIEVPAARSLILPASFSGGAAAVESGDVAAVESTGGGIGQDVVAESAPIAETVEFVQSEGESMGAFAAAVADEGSSDDDDSSLMPVSATVESVDIETAQAAHWAHIGAEAEAMIDYDWESQLPGWTIEYLGDMPGYRGMTHTASNSIAIYINPGDSTADVAGVLAHEIGHALDVNYLDDVSRAAWLEARGMPMVWWAGNGMGDFEVGAGDFAEGFAQMTTGSPSDSAHGEFSGAQLDLLRSLLP